MTTPTSSAAFTKRALPRAAAGFDILLVAPYAGDKKYAMGHVLLR